MSVSAIADICTRSDYPGMGLVHDKHSFLLKKPIGTQGRAHLCTKMDTPSPATQGVRSEASTVGQLYCQPRNIEGTVYILGVQSQS